MKGLQPTNGFRCKIDGCDQDGFNFDDFPEELLFPKNSETGDAEYCKYYRPMIEEASGNCSHEKFSNVIGECGNNAEYAYNSFEFKKTLVTEWNLVCGDSYKVALVISMYMLGLMIGSFLCGRMADKFGRKFTLFFAILCSSAGSLIGSFMPEYFSYTATRYFTSKLSII